MTADPLGLYLGCLFGAEPAGSFVELRYRVVTGGMGRLFLAVRDRAGIAKIIRARGASTDLYIGAAPRCRRGGTREDIERTHALWADIDTDEGREALRAFRPRPSMVVGSGF